MAAKLVAVVGLRLRSVGIVQSPLPFKVGLTLPKTPRNSGMEKLLKGSGGILREGMLLVWVFFLAAVWQMY